MEGKLGGLADRAAEQEQRNRGADDEGVRVGLGGELGEVDGAVGPVTHHDAEEETEVAHAVSDEGFLGRGGGRGVFVPVVDEQVGAKTDELPENEHHEKIVGEHDAEHRKHEDREAAEVAGFGRVFVHVAEREDVDTEADDTDDHQHQRGEVIELEADREGEVA